MNDEDTTIPNSDESEYTTDELEPQRPNKWQGPPSSWAALTAQERGLVASLDQIQNADLSLHLFNAHALKRRAREFEENPEEVRKDHPYVPDEDQTYVPPKSWTAWPLPPHQVPREGEHIGPPDPNEKYTFRRREAPRPSRELEEIVLGLTLKFAKERFLTRGEEKAASSNQTLDVEREDSEEASEPRSSQDEDGAIKEGSAPPPQQESLKPVISIDDDRSRGLLRPSIRHTLAKLDDVLMALHHARKTCTKYQRDMSGISDVSDDGGSEPATPQKRPRGRPRKYSNLPDRSRDPSTPSLADIDDTDLIRMKKSHRGRPLKNYDRLERETNQEYLVRIAKIQRKVLPPFAPPLEVKSEPSPSPSSQRSRSLSRLRTTSEERATKRRKALRPRDWSEVMASAALVGFPADVVARATQRCANLFGEGMDMLTIVEAPFMEKVPDIMKRYVPEAIPNFDEEIVVSSSDDSIPSDETSAEEQDKSKRRNSTSSRSQVPAWQQTCFCPMPDCPRRIKGFKDKDALRRHLLLGHTIENKEVDDYILPSDEETNGAVHVDGFLRPLKRLGGKRGSDMKASKRAKVETSSGESEDDNGAGPSQGRSLPRATTIFKDETVGGSDDGEDEGEEEQDYDDNNGASLAS